MRELVYILFIDAFLKLRKTAICFIMSVRPSVRLKQLGFQWKKFYEI